MNPERQKFEACFGHLDLERDDVDYKNVATNAAWWIWRRAWQQALFVAYITIDKCADRFEDEKREGWEHASVGCRFALSDITRIFVNAEDL